MNTHLLFDFLPDDPGHLIAVELHHRVLHRDLLLYITQTAISTIRCDSLDTTSARANNNPRQLQRHESRTEDGRVSAQMNDNVKERAPRMGLTHRRNTACERPASAVEVEKLGLPAQAQP